VQATEKQNKEKIEHLSLRALLGAIVAVSLRIDVKREQSLGKIALAH
jgi:hypothetical protein